MENLETSKFSYDGKKTLIRTYLGILEQEIAYRKGFIDKAQLKKLAEPLLKSGYGSYLMNLV